LGQGQESGCASGAGTPWCGGVERYLFWTSIIAIAESLVFQGVSYRYSDQLAALEQVAKDKKYNDEMARLGLETATAQQQTEKLRQQNLELEKAITPRSVNQGADDERRHLDRICL
jgi:hypothetical protein